jgi:C-terminal processing protease CtpA/Prc
MNRLIVLTLLGGMLTGATARADGPMTEVASRGWAVADAVLARHVDPPARQQMLLAGVRAMAQATRRALPSGLARRVSDLSGPDQLAALLDEVQASLKVAGEPTKPGLALLPDEPSPGEAFLAGVLAAVPGGATLLPEKERKVQESFEANVYVGIQVQLGPDEKSGRPVFHKVFEGGPADNAGARAGDLIEEIGGESTAGKPMSWVVDHLRGTEGTDVLVRFRRPETDEVFNRPMTRGRLARATVQGLAPLPGKRWKVRLDGPSPIGYLKLTEVAGSTPRELRAFAEQLESEGMKALVLDLRATSSASLHATVLLADALLDGGIIGRVKTSDGETTYRAEPDALFRDLPMVVLAGGNSDPEIFWLCDALVANRRATFVGEPAVSLDPTVSETVPLPGGEWSVRMTTGRLEHGDGRPIDRQPIKGLGPERMAELQRITTELLELSGRPKTPNVPQPGDPNPKSDLTAEFDRLMDQYKAVSGAMAIPAAPPSNPKQDRDLTKAREILADALKSTAK